MLLVGDDVVLGLNFLYLYYRYYDMLAMFRASQGHTAVVDMLIQQQPEMDPSECTLTAPMAAAGRDHASVAELILSRSNINASKKDWRDWTPLDYATQSGHCRVMELLLGRPEVREEKHVIETMLVLAALNNHIKVMRMFLGRRKLDANREC